MTNISIIGTRHESLGYCNSEELYSIIKAINPEVIFEELPPSLFDEYYKHKIRRNLETEAINKFIINHNTIQVPVDSDDVPSDSFFEKYLSILKEIEGSATQNGFHYRNFIDAQQTHIRNLGFTYLNSRHNIQTYIELTKIIEDSLNIFNNEDYKEAYKSWCIINEERENIMLKNICQFCENNTFENAVFTIGSGHLDSIIKKTTRLHESKSIKLNWKFSIS